MTSITQCTNDDICTINAHRIALLAKNEARNKRLPKVSSNQHFLFLPSTESTLTLYGHTMALPDLTGAQKKRKKNPVTMAARPSCGGHAIRYSVIYPMHVMSSPPAPGHCAVSRLLNPARKKTYWTAGRAQIHASFLMAAIRKAN